MTSYLKNLINTRTDNFHLDSHDVYKTSSNKFDHREVCKKQEEIKLSTKSVSYLNCKDQCFGPGSGQQARIWSLTYEWK